MSHDRSGLRIVEDDLSGEPIRQLIAFHLAGMHANSPACSVHAMPVERLRENDVTFFSAWLDNELVGMGALKEIDPKHGELKSMRAAPGHVGRGIGKAMLRHLLAVAKDRRYEQVSLETGRGPAFEPAYALYVAHGFTPCAAFDDYPADDPFSLFLTTRI